MICIGVWVFATASLGKNFFCVNRLPATTEWIAVVSCNRALLSVLAINIDLADDSHELGNGIAIAEPAPTNMLIASACSILSEEGEYDSSQKNLQRALAVFAPGAWRMPRDGSAGRIVRRRRRTPGRIAIVCNSGYSTLVKSPTEAGCCSRLFRARRYVTLSEILFVHDICGKNGWKLRLLSVIFCRAHQ